MVLIGEKFKIRTALLQRNAACTSLHQALGLSVNADDIPQKTDWYIGNAFLWFGLWGGGG